MTSLEAATREDVDAFQSCGESMETKSLPEVDVDISTFCRETSSFCCLFLTNTNSQISLATSFKFPS